MNAINRGFFLSAVVSAVLVAIAAFLYLPGTFAELDRRHRVLPATRASSPSAP